MSQDGRMLDVISQQVMHFGPNFGGKLALVYDAAAEEKRLRHDC
jgi:hypothetical protein